ncbi:GIY-YIG nuclease family protein [Quisquiliibacterium transsilvanicum]|uniref:DNA-binding Lrp family transcriptional regulator n=1 Tax=Quisquiliibacterium transsilvanicum TaxID=1549638 RepID=A0A7W8HG07_9BURK|nr:GIY-YIG nuclease family protein [Quisquiliibacterium transsilvanicum]MBB5271351.1 DNA-binding Lrp family transcriptional regulator [Quisquiliibacterium transsilvanicum]
MKRPSFQFYPGDWRRDSALQSCSIAARGLWVELMCVMHDCEPYGHLVIGGKAMQPAQLARLVGLSGKECGTLLAELEEAGVLSRSESGVIYSRRMVRDEATRNARAEGGKAGASHGVKGKDYGSLGGRGGQFDGPGLLYAARRVSGGPIKIGVTRHLKQRMSSLRSKVGEEISLLWSAQVSDMQAAEAYLLKQFEGSRDGEWIDAEWGAVRDAITEGPHPPFEPPIEPPPSSSSSSASADSSLRSESGAVQAREPAPGGPSDRPTGAVALAIEARRRGVDTNGSDPRLLALAEQGVTVDALGAACDEAVRQHPGERVGIGLVAAILTRWAGQARRIAAVGAAPPRDAKQAALERRNAEVAARWRPPELMEVGNAD